MAVPTRPADLRGAGQAWSDPVAGIVALSGQKQQREWAAFGLWESGDLVVTILRLAPLRPG